MCGCGVDRERRQIIAYGRKTNLAEIGTLVRRLEGCNPPEVSTTTGNAQPAAGLW